MAINVAVVVSFAVMAATTGAGADVDAIPARGGESIFPFSLTHSRKGSTKQAKPGASSLFMEDCYAFIYATVRKVEKPAAGSGSGTGALPKKLPEIMKPLCRTSKRVKEADCARWATELESIVQHKVGSKMNMVTSDEWTAAVTGETLTYASWCGKLRDTVGAGQAQAPAVEKAEKATKPALRKQMTAKDVSEAKAVPVEPPAPERSTVQVASSSVTEKKTPQGLKAASTEDKTGTVRAHLDTVEEKHQDDRGSSQTQSKKAVTPKCSCVHRDGKKKCHCPEATKVKALGHDPAATVLAQEKTSVPNTDVAQVGIPTPKEESSPAAQPQPPSVGTKQEITRKKAVQRDSMMEAALYFGA